MRAWRIAGWQEQDGSDRMVRCQLGCLVQSDFRSFSSCDRIAREVLHSAVHSDMMCVNHALSDPAWTLSTLEKSTGIENEQVKRSMQVDRHFLLH